MLLSEFNKLSKNTNSFQIEEIDSLVFYTDAQLEKHQEKLERNIKEISNIEYLSVFYTMKKQITHLKNKLNGKD